MADHKFGKRTMLIHGDLNGKAENTERNIKSAIAFPIFQTTAFVLDSVKQAQEVFAQTDLKHEAYTRYSNPDHRFLEERLAMLEGGEAAQVFDSGMSAIKAVIESLTDLGDEIIAHKNLYGGTYALFRKWSSKFGVKTVFIDVTDYKAVLKAVSPRTKMVFLETISNPVLDICDCHEIKTQLKIIQRPDILVVADNTFATPCNHRPLKLGADIVIHALTKYLNGFGNHFGGAIVTSRELMNKIWEGYGYSGGVMDPEVALRIAMNMQTIFDRISRHNFNAEAVSLFLSCNQKVRKVYYPGLPTHPNHETAERLMSGFGGMVSFELEGSRDKTEAFLNQLRKDQYDGRGVITHSVSLGTMGSLIICPALTTHFQVSREERLAQGINDNLIRMSVGTENIDDIFYSLERGFETII